MTLKSYFKAGPFNGTLILHEGEKGARALFCPCLLGAMDR